VISSLTLPHQLRIHIETLTHTLTHTLWERVTTEAIQACGELQEWIRLNSWSSPKARNTFGSNAFPRNSSPKNQIVSLFRGIESTTFGLLWECITAEAVYAIGEMLELTMVNFCTSSKAQTSFGCNVFPHIHTHNHSHIGVCFRRCCSVMSWRTRTLAFTHSLPHTHTHTQTHTPTHTHARTHTHAHTHTLSLFLSLFLSFSLSRFLPLFLSLSLSHTGGVSGGMVPQHSHEQARRELGLRHARLPRWEGMHHAPFSVIFWDSAAHKYSHTLHTHTTFQKDTFQGVWVQGGKDK